MGSLHPDPALHMHRTPEYQPSIDEQTPFSSATNGVCAIRALSDGAGGSGESYVIGTYWLRCSTSARTNLSGRGTSELVLLIFNRTDPHALTDLSILNCTDTHPNHTGDTIFKTIKRLTSASMTARPSARLRRGRRMRGR